MVILFSTRAGRVLRICVPTTLCGPTEHGISSEIRVVGERWRRIASWAPPALIFMAVANSTNLWPLSSVPWTKTGIARGNRCQCRRSDFVRKPTEYPLGYGFRIFIAKSLTNYLFWIFNRYSLSFQQLSFSSQKPASRIAGIQAQPHFTKYKKLSYRLKKLAHLLDCKTRLIVRC